MVSLKKTIYTGISLLEIHTAYALASQAISSYLVGSSTSHVAAPPHVLSLGE